MKTMLAISRGLETLQNTSGAGASLPDFYQSHGSPPPPTHLLTFPNTLTATTEKFYMNIKMERIIENPVQG